MFIRERTRAIHNGNDSQSSKANESDYRPSSNAKNGDDVDHWFQLLRAYKSDDTHNVRIRKLIPAGVDGSITDDEEKTALFYAVQESNNESVVCALIDDGSDVNKTDNEGKTALFYAVQQSNNEIVVCALIDAGADVNRTDNEGKTALFYAVQESNNESVVRALIYAGAYDVNRTDNEGKTALFYAVQESNNESVVHVLIYAGADVNMTDNEGKTALFYAVQECNNESVVCALIDDGADVNMTDNEGKSALFYAFQYTRRYWTLEVSNAIQHCEKDVRALLIDAGADVNITDNMGKTALSYAVRLWNNESVVCALIDAGADVNIPDNEGKTALLYAVLLWNNKSVVHALIAAGADVNRTDNEGKTALLYAVQLWNNKSLVSALIAAGADVNITDKEEKNALFYAVQVRNNKSVVRALIDAGADVKIAGNMGENALFYAVQNGYESVVRALIAVGADVNITDEGTTALLYAVQQSNNESVACALIDAGADVNRTDNEGKTALFFAVQQSNNESVVRALIDAGADVNMTDNEGKTALFYVKDHNSWECTNVARTLIEYGGAVVKVRDHYGRTPLLYTLGQSLSLTQYLLEKGGDLHLKDNCSLLTYFIDNYYISLLVKSMDLEPFGIWERLSFFMKETKVNKKSIFEAIVSVAFIRTLYVKPGFSDTNAKCLSQLLRLACRYSVNSWFERRNPRDVIEIALNMIETNKEQKLLIDSKDITTILNELCKLGVNPNTVDSEGNTALHYATQLALQGVSQDKVMEICHQLKEFNVSFDVKNHKNETPLLFCLSRTDENMSRHCYTWSEVEAQVAVCKFLIGHGSKLEEKTQSGKSVLHLVLELLRQALLKQDGELRKGVLGEVIRLIEEVFMACNPLSAISKENNRGNTALHLWATLKLASDCDHDDYFRIVAEGYTFQGLLKLILDLLREKKVQLNVKNENGETPLHLCRTWTAIELLLDAGANPNDVDSSGHQPLFAAAKINESIKNRGILFPDVSLAPDVFWKTVLKRDLDPWAVDKDGESVLSIIIRSEASDLASAMVEVACEKLRDHPLVIFSLLTSICKDKLANVHWKKDTAERILTSTKCHVNGNDTEDSPLHYCCRNIREALKGSSVDEIKMTVHWSMVKLLRSYGADYRIRDTTNQSCLDIADECPELKALLTGPIDLDGFPVNIKHWRSVSKSHERYLAEVARHLESEYVEPYWYHKDELQSGSFGSVFAGINEKDGREVAIKRIVKRSVQERPQDEREIKSLIALADCEQVVSYLCFFEDKHFSYIVLELMEGNLDDLLNKTIPIKEKEILCRDVVKGLTYVHGQGYLHRDLKPTNILFKNYPKLCLKIADFGLSRRIDSTGSTTVYGINAGTRCWIAPEVLSKNSPTKSSDVFACGLVLHYTLSVKKHPFALKTGALQHEIEANISKGKMEGWDDSLCPETAHLLKAMLDSNDSKRPAAAEALDHPFFWTNQKKMDFLIAVGNQSEFECPRAKRTLPFTAVETDLETKFSTIIKYVDWNDPGYANMPTIYTEMMKKRKTPYDIKSVVELVRFVRNAIAHVSESTRPPPIKKQLLEDFVFLEYFPNLVMEVYKAVTTHGWDQTRKEIKYAMNKY